MNPMKQNKNNIDGILLLNKPIGISSNTAVQKLKRIYNASKVGHTGTLDPLATGLLPLCFGEATKFSSYLLDADKEYIATIQLGITTTTYDSEGDIVENLPVCVNIEQIKNVLTIFLGKITQIPPIYSALKVNGKPLYKYAREGVDVEIKSREITIHELEILGYNETNSQLKLRVLSSKGTYIRSLASDIGKKLSCGASLCGLIRTKTNQFTLDLSHTLDAIMQLDINNANQLLLPVDTLVQHLAKIDLSLKQMNDIILGRILSSDEWFNLANNELVRLYCDNRFLGLGRYANNQIISHRLLNTQQLINIG